MVIGGKPVTDKSEREESFEAPAMKMKTKGNRQSFAEDGSGDSRGSADARSSGDSRGSGDSR